MSIYKTKAHLPRNCPFIFALISSITHKRIHTKQESTMQRFYLLFALALSLTACGGSASSGGRSGGQAVPFFAFDTTPSLSSQQVTRESNIMAQTLPESDSETPEYTQAEYTNSTHLSTIKANYAYGKGLSGKGITLGVVDRPINLAHPEFCSSDDSMCKKGVRYDHTSLFNREDGYNMNKSHGTRVASVMAGAYNRSSSGMMGVAYNANLTVFGIDIDVQDDFAEATGNQEQDQSSDSNDRLSRLKGIDIPLAQIYRALNRFDLPAINLSLGILFYIHQYEKKEIEDNFANALAALHANEDTVYVYAAGNAQPGDEPEESPSVTSALARTFP